MIDTVFKTQAESGIIEKIPDLNKFMNENDSCSFLAHMPVFRLEKESTKCRVVFLANVNDKRERDSLSHNQTICTGPNLNKKMSTSILQLRFDEKL